MAIVLTLINLYSLVIVARAIASFFPISPSSAFAPIVDLLYRLTEPVFAPVRRVLPPMGGFDFAPLVVLLVLNFVIVPILV